MDHGEIRNERAKKYGDFYTNHKNIANAWHSIICSYYQKELPPLPPHIACLMFTVFKAVRASIPFKFDLDDYRDMRNYQDFAKECDPDNPVFVATEKVKCECADENKGCQKHRGPLKVMKNENNSEAS